MGRLNGHCELAGRLREADFQPSADTGGGELVYWGRCHVCGHATNKVDLTARSPVAVCRDCGTRQPVLELLEALEGEGDQGGEGPRVTTLRVLRERVPPSVDWLVDGLLPGNGLSLLVSKPKVGKSTLARCLAVAVASGGGEWLGRTVTREGVVIHLPLEERLDTVIDHYDRLEDKGERLYVLEDQPPPMGKRLSWLRGIVEDLDPALVLIDPVQRWVRVSDGNAYAETTNALTPLIDIARERRTHVMLVHHARKSPGEHGDEVLGSTAFAGSVDTILSIKRRGDERTISAEGRDGVGMEETVLTKDERGWVSASGRKREADGESMAERVLEWMGERGERVTQQVIVEGVGAAKTKVVEALERLQASGAVDREGEGKRGCPYTYDVRRGLELS